MAEKQDMTTTDVKKHETQLPLVEVTAEQLQSTDRSEEKQRLSEGTPTTNLNARELKERPNRHIGDALKRMPGVYMGGAPTENKDIRLRGIDKEYTRTTIDGLLIPDGGEKRELQLDRIPTALVQNVTLIKNPTAEWESDGIGGRVHLETRTIPNEFILEAKVGGGARPNNQGELLTQGYLYAGKKVNSWLGIQGVSSWMLDPQKKERTENEYNIIGYTKKIKTEDENKKISTYNFWLDHAVFVGNSEFHVKPMFLFFNENKRKIKTEFDRTKTTDKDETAEKEFENKSKQTYGLVINHQQKFNPNKARTEHSFSYYSTSEFKGGNIDDSKLKETYKETAGTLNLDATTKENEKKSDKTWAFSSKTQFPFEWFLKNEAKFGANGRLRNRDRNKKVIETKATGTITDKTTAKDSYQLTEQYAAVYLQNEIWLINTLSLLPGLRYELSQTTTNVLIGDKVMQTTSDFNPHPHLNWKILETLRFKAAVSRSVNRPKFDDLSPFKIEETSKITIGNAMLKPATSENYDLVLEGGNRHFFLSGGFFHKYIHSVMEEVNTQEIENGKSIYQMRNVGNGFLQGIELEQKLTLSFFDMDVTRNLTLWSNQTFLRSQLQDSLGVTRPFKEQPHLLINLGIDWQISQWGTIITMSANYASQRRSVETTGDEKTLAAEWTYDLAFRQTILQTLSFYIEWENIANVTRKEVTLKTNSEKIEKEEKAGVILLLGLKYEF